MRRLSLDGGVRGVSLIGGVLGVALLVRRELDGHRVLVDGPALGLGALGLIGLGQDAALDQV